MRATNFGHAHFVDHTPYYMLPREYIQLHIIDLYYKLMMSQKI